jgi:hypothetical protein
METNNVGIVRSKSNGIDYTFWKDAEIVKPFIKKYLKGRFPDKKIIRELNRIDISIPEINLPVEIQATPLDPRTGTPLYAKFESKIRTQIEQNVIAYNRCWFFFDPSLLKSMKNSGRRASINMDWFRSYIKEEKLKVFTVSHDGIIEELEYSDFDFLSTMSQTCKVAYETDDMVLNRNKMKIYTNVVKGYRFTQKEIDSFEYSWKSRKEKKVGDNFTKYMTTQCDSRMKLYGNILHATGSLSDVNNLLDLSIENMENVRKHPSSILGIFDNSGMGQGSITRFVDRFDICKYFPGYVRNQEIWQMLKGLNLNNRQFSNVIMGKTDVINGIEYYRSH